MTSWLYNLGFPPLFNLFIPVCHTLVFLNRKFISIFQSHSLICFSWCSGEPYQRPPDSKWFLNSESELSCWRRLQLQQRSGVSLWAWVIFHRRLIRSDASGYDMCSLLTFTADYLSTLSMSSTSLGSDSESAGLDNVSWSPASEFRKADKGTLLKVCSL